MTDTMVTVHWEKCSDGRWYSLEAASLLRVRGSGVYVIWCEGQPPATVCVGHGDLTQRLLEHFEDRAIEMYRELGELRFTWAYMPAEMQRGAARYLTERYNPAFGDTATLVPSVEVNLPE